MDVQLMERWNSLSVSEMRILREIVARIEQGDDRVPIRAVAQASFVSTTSIVRLAKKLGFEGFSELLYSLKHERASSLAPNMPGFCERMVASEESRSQLESLAEELALGSYERINIMGVGYSDLTACYLCNRLLEHGFFASTKSPLDFRDDRSYLMLFVSESGETKDLTFVQDRCRPRGVVDYVFTADRSSTLGSGSAHCILVERKGCRADKEENFFVINCLTLVEDLMIRVRELREERES